MRKQNKNSGINGLKLALIITGSIIAAAGIIFIVVKLMKKLHERKMLTCDCGCDCDCCDDDWGFDDDMLGELRFDDEECECGCSEKADDASNEISAAVDEAIEAIEAVNDEE